MHELVEPSTKIHQLHTEIPRPISSEAVQYHSHTAPWRAQKELN